MPTIEIDFDVFKALTSLREREEVTYNDVIRRLLDLGDKKPVDLSDAATNGDREAWVCKGVRFPAGTEFRASYKGEEHRGVVKEGALLLNGRRLSSPSDAARAVTNTSVNGWNFWECRFPGETRWTSISGLRSKR